MQEIFSRNTINCSNKNHSHAPKWRKGPFRQKSYVKEHVQIGQKCKVKYINAEYCSINI